MSMLKLFLARLHTGLIFCGVVCLHFAAFPTSLFAQAVNSFEMINDHGNLNRSKPNGQPDGSIPNTVRFILDTRDGALLTCITAPRGACTRYDAIAAGSTATGRFRFIHGRTGTSFDPIKKGVLVFIQDTTKSNLSYYCNIISYDGTSHFIPKKWNPSCIREEKLPEYVN
jgi:hypothetical protein